MTKDICFSKLSDTEFVLFPITIEEIVSLLEPSSRISFLAMCIEDQIEPDSIWYTEKDASKNTLADLMSFYKNLEDPFILSMELKSADYSFLVDDSTYFVLEFNDADATNSFFAKIINTFEYIKKKKEIIAAFKVAELNEFVCTDGEKSLCKYPSYRETHVD